MPLTVPLNVRHCPLVEDKALLDADEKEALIKLAIGPRQGLRVKKLKGTEDILRIRVNKKKRMFIMITQDANGQRFNRYLGREVEGKMENHKYNRNSIARNKNQEVENRRQLDAKMKINVDDLINQDWIEAELEPDNQALVDAVLQEETVYYFDDKYLTLTPSQETAVYKTKVIYLGPAGSGKTYIGCFNLFYQKDILFQIINLNGGDPNAYCLYYLTSAARLCKTINKAFRKFDVKNIHACTYEELTLKLHRNYIAQYRIEWLLENRNLNEIDTFYFSFNQNKSALIYQIKNLHNQLKQGMIQFSQLSKLKKQNVAHLSEEILLKILRNSRQEIVNVARKQGHICAQRLSCATEQESYLNWFDQFISSKGSNGQKLKIDLQLDTVQFSQLKENTSLIYQEFRIISGFTREEDYLAYCNLEHRTHFTKDGKNQKFCFRAFSFYLNFLSAAQQCNLDFYVWTEKGDFAGGFFDEAQNEPLIHLVNFKNALKKYQPIDGEEQYLGNISAGSHQNVCDYISNVDYIQTVLGFKPYHLAETHRCPQLVVDVAYNVIRAMETISGGGGFINEPVSITASEEMKKVEGRVRYFKKLSTNEWKRLARIIQADADSVVIVPDSYLEEARENLGEGQVFTPDALIGSQFHTVYLINPFHGADFTAVNNEFIDEKKIKTATKPHLSKHDRFENRKLLKVLSGLYVGLTRSSRNVTIIQDGEHGNEHLVSFLFDAYICDGVDDTILKISTSDDWVNYLREIYRREEEDPIAYANSLSIFIKRLNGKKEDFAQFLIKIGLEEADENEKIKPKMTTIPLPKMTKKKKNRDKKGNNVEQNSLQGKTEAIVIEPKAEVQSSAVALVDKPIIEKQYVFGNKSAEGSSNFPSVLLEYSLLSKKSKQKAPLSPINLVGFEQKIDCLTKQLQENFTLNKLAEVYEKLGKNNTQFFQLLMNLLLANADEENGNSKLPMSSLVGFLDKFRLARKAFSPENLTTVWKIKALAQEFEILPISRLVASAEGRYLIVHILNFYPDFGHQLCKVNYPFLPHNLAELLWTDVHETESWMLFLAGVEDDHAYTFLMHLMETGLYEYLFVADQAQRGKGSTLLIDNRQINFLQHCINQGKVMAVKAVINCTKFSITLLEQKNSLEIIAREPCLEAIINQRLKEQEQAIFLWDNFQENNLKKILFKHSNVNIKKLESGELARIQQHFIKLFFINQFDLAGETSVSPSLIYHVLNDNIRAEVFIKFLKANACLLANLLDDYESYGTVLVKRLLYTKFGSKMIMESNCSHVLMKLLLTKSHEFFDSQKLTGKVWGEIESTDSLLIAILKNEDQSSNAKLLDQLFKQKKALEWINNCFNFIDENGDNFINFIIKTPRPEILKMIISNVQFCSLSLLSHVNKRNFTPITVFYQTLDETWINYGTLLHDGNTIIKMSPERLKNARVFFSTKLKRLYDMVLPLIELTKSIVDKKDKMNNSLYTLDARQQVLAVTLKRCKWMIDTKLLENAKGGLEAQVKQEIITLERKASGMINQTLARCGLGHFSTRSIIDKLDTIEVYVKPK